jgi:hypothetical protein
VTEKANDVTEVANVTDCKALRPDGDFEGSTLGVGICEEAFDLQRR